MELNINNYQNHIDVTSNIIETMNKVMNEVMSIEDITLDSVVNVLLVDNNTIRDYNFKYRNIDNYTDCLSFPMLSYKQGQVFNVQYKEKKFQQYDLEDGKLLLGDIVISLEKAFEQSLEFNHSLNREINYLFIHSLLHLLGYDHIEDRERSIMRSREEEILNLLNIFR